MPLNLSDLLVHTSNVLMLVSYSVRSILWLRWFAVAAALTVIPYYLVQPTILWPPIFWGTVFTGINLFQIARIYAERRPVVFSDDERKLYDLGFSTLRPREFLSLILAGEWKEAKPGEKLLKEHETATAICVAIEGSIAVESQSKPITKLEPGYLIGTGLSLSGHASPVTASFETPGRYMRWPLVNLRAFLERKPELRVILQGLVNRDLARKVEEALAVSRDG